MHKAWHYIVTAVLVLPLTAFSQSWTLRLISSVEKDGKPLSGANLKLYQGSKIVSQSLSGPDGDFSIEIPPNGDFILVVSYGDCNSKKFQISTLGVPEEISNDRFKPSFEIGGVTMAKPLYSIDYSVLNQPLVKIAYISARKKFDHDEMHTEQMLMALSRIREAEKALIQKQQESCKAGDEALKKKDCDLAKQNYEKAVALIPQLPYETYPKEQLLKVNQCFESKNQLANKEKEAAAAKLAAEKAAADKAEADRIAKEKLAAAKEKAEKDRVATENAAKTKAEAERLAKEKQNADKAAAEQAAKAKAEADKAANDRKAAEIAAAEAAAKQKANSEKTAKESKPAEKAIPVKKDEPGKKEDPKPVTKNQEETKVEPKPASKTPETENKVKSKEKETVQKKEEKIQPKSGEEEPKKKKKQKETKSKYSIRPRL